MKKYKYSISSTEHTEGDGGQIAPLGATSFIIINKGDRVANIDIGDNGTVDFSLEENESISFDAPDGEFSNQVITYTFDAGTLDKLIVVRTTRVSILQAP